MGSQNTCNTYFDHIHAKSHAPIEAYVTTVVMTCYCSSVPCMMQTGGGGGTRVKAVMS